MHINNKCAWIEWFSVSNLTLELATSLGRTGILQARNVLKQKGYIKIKTNGVKATGYKMINLYDNSDTPSGVSSGVLSDIPSDVLSDTLNKQNKTKLNKENQNHVLIATKDLKDDEYEKLLLLVNGDKEELDYMLGGLDNWIIDNPLKL